MRYRRLKSLLAAVLCLLTVVGLGPAPAVAAARTDRDDAARAAEAVRRAEALLENAGATARAAARRLALASSALPGAQHRVAVARGVVIATRVEADTARDRAAAARQSYQRIAADWAAAQDRVAAARERVAGIARSSYMGGSVSRLNLLVSATAPVDLMDRMTLVDQLVHQENADMRQLIGARRAARAAQDRAGAAKRQAEAAESEAAAKLRAAQSAQVDAVRARRDVYQLVLSRRAALSAANAQRAGVLAQYRAALAAERRVRSSMRGWEHRSGYTGRYHGRLLMPVHGWKSSDYGNRYDPYYRVWQLHAGTDFAAGSGTPIRAAAAGRVIQAGWNGGYGNYTCISHGRVMGTGFSTCYGHQSRIYVHVGQYVRQGEVIGKVGSTGASTGAHLHFETRFGGAPRNPLNYLPSCLC